MGRPRAGRTPTKKRIANANHISHARAMESPSPRRRLWQEVLAITAISTIGLVYLGLRWEVGPPSFTTGQIVGFGLAEQKVYSDNASIVRAEVKVPDGRSVSVMLPGGAPCRIGSTIQIEEARTLFGARFTAGLRGCSTPPVVPSPLSANRDAHGSISADAHSRSD